MIRPLGQILKEKYNLNEEMWEDALNLQKERGGKIGDILVRFKYIKEDDLLGALCTQLDIPFIAHIDVDGIDKGLLASIPIAFAKKFLLLPIKKENGCVVIATSNPTNLSPLDDLRIIFGSDIRPVAALSRDIVHCINQVYDRTSNSAEQVIEDMNGEDLGQIASELEEPEDILEATDEAPIIRLVNSLLFQAVKEGASDIHIEPFEREISIRYRIDGILYNILSPPKRLQSSIISRIKIMASLDIAEKRLPQDGRIGLKIAGKDVDIRVSVIPTAYGERVVLRLLDKSSKLLNLEDVGLSEEEMKEINRLIHMSHGIILVTGPTGSGKTTTLYAALNRINSPDKNIITIEDPIEYQINGVGQMHVNPKINLTFANGLRSILRQDPDVIMVGEIRDMETAEIAIHASLTGHLVFSTLHTNDSAGAITRLVDMGIEPFLVSSAMVAIIAQRLVRVLCRECRQAYLPGEEELLRLSINREDIGNANFYLAKGCPSCMNRGYKGRIGIYEILLMDDELRQMIMERSDSSTIKSRAQKKGMKSLKEDGARKVIAGTTTTEEVLRVTEADIG